MNSRNSVLILISIITSIWSYPCQSETSDVVPINYLQSKEVAPIVYAVTGRKKHPLFSEKTVMELAQEIRDCGLKTFGPKCKNSCFSAAFDSGSRERKVEHRNIFISSFKADAFATEKECEFGKSFQHFVIVKDQRQSKNGRKFHEHIAIFVEEYKNWERDLFEQYLEGDLFKLFDVKTPHYPLRNALFEIQRTRRYRRFFHLLEYICKNYETKEQLEGLVPLIMKNLPLIFESGDRWYQEGFINLIHSYFKKNKELIVATAKGLLNVPPVLWEGYDTRRAALIYLIEQGVFKVGKGHEITDLRSRIRNLYIENKFEPALSEVVDAMERAKQGVNDEKLQIAAMGNYMGPGRKAAYAAVQKYTLTDAHLPGFEKAIKRLELKKYSYNSDFTNWERWTIFLDRIIPMIRSIGSPKSKMFLIETRKAYPSPYQSWFR